MGMPLNATQISNIKNMEIRTPLASDVSHGVVRRLEMRQTPVTPAIFVVLGHDRKEVMRSSDLDEAIKAYDDV